MANNRLILRKMTSPWVTQHMDITRSTTLTHVELDSNFVYLKGEVITSVSVDGNTLILNKINGNTIDVDIEGLSGDTGQTLNLINQLRGELDEDALWEAESAGSKSIKLKNSDTIGATVYTPRLNIKVEPSRDNSVTQVLVRDSDGYVKYKDVSSFTDLSVVGGDYNVQTGVVTLTNNDGNSFDISGFSKNMTDSYTTNAYIEDGVMYFDNNVHGPKYYQVNVNELINVIIDRGDCSEEQYSQYLKLANEYESINDDKVKHENELASLEGDVSELYKLINTLKIQVDSLDPEQDADQIAKLAAQIEIYKNSVEEKLKLISVSKDKIKLLSSNSILEFATYMPINESNFNCWARTQIINIIGYEDRGACSEDDYNTYVKMGQKVLDENENIQTLQLELSENERILKTYKDRIAELEAMPQPLPDDLQKELNVLIEDGYSLEAQIKIDSEIIKTWLESDEYNFMTQYMPINEVNFICWKHSQLLSMIEECCKDDERGDCSDDKYQQYLKLANQYSTTKELFDTITETQTQLTILINEGVTTISEKEAQLLKLKKQLEDLLNSGGNPDLPFDVNLAISNIDELLVINTEYDINLGLWSNGIGSTEEDFNNRKGALLDSLNKMLEKTNELETLLHLTFGSPSYGTEYGIKEELKLHLMDIKGIANAGGSGTGILQASMATVNAQTWTGDYSGWGDWMVDIINPLIVQSMSSTSSIQSHLTNIKNKINAANANPGSGDNAELIAELQKQIASLTKELEDLTKVLDSNKTELVSIERQLIEITSSGILEFEVYMPINEVNFDCWSEQLIIDAVGYEDRGECSLKSYTEYTTEANTYTKNKEVYDDLIEHKSELMTQITQFKTDIADLIAARASKQTELDRLKSEDPNSPLIPVLEEEIKQLNRGIEDFTAQLSQKEVELERTNERIHIIEDSGVLDFGAYMPINEVNFDCWSEAKLYNELNIKIESITNIVGYDDRGKCSSDKYAVYLKEVAKYESKKSHYDSNIEERDSVKINIDELELDIDTLETELVILNNDRLYKVTIGESIEELQKTISDKEAELSGKKNDLTILRDRYSLAIEEVKVIEDSSDLEFVAYMPANEINFDCWTEQQIIDAVGYGDRGDCSEALYEEYINIINVSNDFYNKSLVPPSNWDALDLPDSISYKDLSLYMKKSVEFRNNQVLEFNQTLALYDSELKKYQAILDPLKVIENPTEEQLAEINGLEKIIKLLNANREKLISDNNTDEKLYIELTKWFSDNIDYWNNSEYKVILETYGPVNEVNFICYVNNLQNDKIDKLIKDNEYKIYNIESQLNDSSLGNEGTFNYYPNVYDDFSGNPKFSVGNFDELDSIINLSSNDLVTWGKLVCNGGVGGTIMKNLITSIRCIESLKNEITSIEAKEANDFNNLKNIYETEIQNLRSQQQSDPRLTTDLLEVKLSNMIAERSLNSDSYEYMVDKLKEVLEVYKHVNAIADDFCDNGGA